MEKIGLTRAMELLQAAVRTRGEDFVYQDKANWADGVGCINVPFTDDMAAACGVNVSGMPAAGSPKRITGCIVGTALALGGVPVHEIPRGPVGEFREFLTEAAYSALQVAQIAQDFGASWGAARDIAIAAVDHLRSRLMEAGLPVRD